MRIRRIIILLASAYLLVCGCMYTLQRSIMYCPVPEADAGRADEVWLTNEDERLRLLLLNADRPHAILYFGGNAENVAFDVPDFAAWFPGCAVWLVNYRGYGGSSGSPSEEALYRDAEATYDLVRQKHPSVTVIGRSLGSGVATHLASVREVERLVLITPFDSIANVARSVYPFLPTSLLLKDRYDSEARAHLIDAPTLLLVAEHDEIIDLERSRALANAIDPALLQWESIPATGHNTISASPAYWSALRKFACPAGGPMP